MPERSQNEKNYFILNTAQLVLCAIALVTLFFNAAAGFIIALAGVCIMLVKHALYPLSERDSDAEVDD